MTTACTGVTFRALQGWCNISLEPLEQRGAELAIRCQRRCDARNAPQYLVVFHGLEGTVRRVFDWGRIIIVNTNTSCQCFYLLIASQMAFTRMHNRNIQENWYRVCWFRTTPRQWDCTGCGDGRRKGVARDLSTMNFEIWYFSTDFRRKMFFSCFQVGKSGISPLLPPWKKSFGKWYLLAMVALLC